MRNLSAPTIDSYFSEKTFIIHHLMIMNTYTQDIGLLHGKMGFTITFLCMEDIMIIRSIYPLRRIY